MTKNQQWYALEISVEPAASEAVEFGLNELGADGTEINNLGKVSGETINVIGYFEIEPSAENARAELDEALRIYGFLPETIRELSVRKIENQDWLAEWKKHWRPTETEKFIIAPTWEKFTETPAKQVIYIEPSMAFGTGTHETTKLCLKAIEENYAPEMSFFDVGTGTGILAVGAAKVQSKSEEAKGKIEGCDTDENSIKIAKENALLNQTEDIEFYVGSIEENSPEFDFVCANLTIDVIVPILNLLVEKSRTYLILSGILKEQENQIIEELEKLKIADYKIETLGIWISVVAKFP